MRVGFAMVIFSAVTFSQGVTFEIASVKSNPRPVGPDYNNQLTISPTQLVGRNITLRLLISEASSVQRNQVVGPRWLDENEYDIDARTGSEVSQERMRSMLQALLMERFHLREHTERRTIREYELMVDKGGPKIAPAKGAAAATTDGGFLFHGGMRQLADLIAVQLTIPTATDPTRPAIGGGPPPLVLDKTGLDGVYDFAVDVRPEPGVDAFTLWQRFAQERLGLRLESRRGLVRVVVVDSAERTPEAN
jgi:uncharacterized protein (TIGR03435 family)